MISLCVTFITHPHSLTANCQQVALFPSRYSHHASVSLSLLLSPAHPTPLLTTITLWLLFALLLLLLSPFSPPLSPSSLLLYGVCPLCASCRLALDDAIRHKQLNISRFSPRVAGENDFLQTVINKVITAKEVNHKGQGTVPVEDVGNNRSQPYNQINIHWYGIKELCKLCFLHSSSN